MMPKPYKIILGAAKGRRLRQFLYDLYDEHCPECGRWREINQLHLHHIKSRGSGGDDRLSNLSWECFECHRKEHDGN